MTGPPAFHAVLEKTIALVEAADAEYSALDAIFRGTDGAQHAKAPKPMRDALTNFLYQRSEGDLAKLQTLLHVGRGDVGCVRTAFGQLPGRSRSRETLVALFCSSPVAPLLERGIEAARKQGLDLDGEWTPAAPPARPPPARRRTPIPRNPSRPRGTYVLGRMKIKKPPQ